ncbi:MAG: ORF6N domain-containing protein [Bacteroidota bacterium]|nr:ORF6N domain-containing protein [Bacteroidota bacterium]
MKLNLSMFFFLLPAHLHYLHALSIILTFLFLFYIFTPIFAALQIMTKPVVKSNYETLIFPFRGRKLMLDVDLALLYDVLTKALKQQVKRNISRFPEDFIPDSYRDEPTMLERQELINNSERLASLKFSNIKPMVFTEQGVSMLSSVLSSEKAIQVNIEIMRAFANYRSLLSENEEYKK